MDNTRGSQTISSSGKPSVQRNPTITNLLPPDLSDSDDDLVPISTNSIGTDFELLDGFNETDARQKLISFNDCSKITLSIDLQKEMTLEIGVNLTAEHPWKQIKRDTVLDYIVENGTPEIDRLREKISLMADDELVLVGYAHSLSNDENDVFLFFENALVAKEAGLIIEKIEANERRKAKAAIIKKPNEWKSLGSEVEVDLCVKPLKVELIDVEIQSIYSVNYDHKPFEMRLADDSRDGYVELLPRKLGFENIHRITVDVAIQSAPPRVHLEQQTEPTFPANAWAQYLYEIADDVNEADQEAKEEALRAKQHRPGMIVTPVEETPPVSKQITELLQILEFNQIDMYRNDYPFVAEKQSVNRYKIPYLTEAFCFVQMEKSINRYVCDLDWHPNLSGLVLVTYTFSTMCTQIKPDDKTDYVKRAVLSPNPILLWSFDDHLDPKLELETPREVTCISFCPYDENLVIGGTINGQLIIWDTKDRLKKVETEEILTISQLKYRLAMRRFLSWTKDSNQHKVIPSVAISSLEQSQRDAITAIEWFNQRHFVAATGLVRESESPDAKNRYFVTASADGTIAFWDLNFSNANENKKISNIRKSKKKTPDFMVQEESEYAKLNGLFCPLFVLVYNQPVTSIIMDRGLFKFQPIDAPKNRKITNRVKHKVTPVAQDEFIPKIVCSSFLGNLSILTWEGSEFIPGIEVKKETIQQPELYAEIHDGPILKIHRNPFVHNLFLSIGQNILALWKDDCQWEPIFWRYRPYKLTDCKWSTNRPAVFYISREDGTLEAWNLLCRTDEPSVMDSLGGSILTTISQHKLTLPEEVICVGDYNSSLRTLKIPTSLARPQPNEIEQLQMSIKREEDRKKHLKKWQHTYYMAHDDVRKAKMRAAEETQAALERLEKELKEKEELRQRKEDEEIRKAKLRENRKAVFDLPERLQAKWDEMNIKRLMKVLMSMKMIDPNLMAVWTKPEKERITYNQRKRKAIAESFRNILEEVTTLRTRLLPIEHTAEDRTNVIRQSLQMLLDDNSDGGSGDIMKEPEYEEISRETMDYINNHKFQPKIEFSEILTRAAQRREVLNKSLGANTQHRYTYEKLKKNRISGEFHEMREKAASAQSLLSIAEISESDDVADIKKT